MGGTVGVVGWSYGCLLKYSIGPGVVWIGDGEVRCLRMRAGLGFVGLDDLSFFVLSL